jgi:4-hydroxythreonine-4-phosphate dehydrogenase
MAVTIVADDLTGACDAGTLFAGRAPVPVTVWPAAPAAADVAVVDTESRHLARDEAAARVSGAVERRPAATSWFKKIDSTLRGHVGAEIVALLDATGAPSAVACPAFPSEGRVVLDRVLRVDGAAAVHVVDMIRSESVRPLAWVPLAEVRAGTVILTARLAQLRGMIVVADAETDDDLDAIVGAALALEPVPLLAGSAGLAQPLAARLGLSAGRAALPGGQWLIVAGSLHPATRRQLAEARRAGLRVLATADAERGDTGEAAATLAREALRLLATESFDLIVLTGGDVAVAFYRTLGATRIDLVGAPRPGLAFGYVRAPGHPVLPVLTKAGGFGASDLFVSLWKEAAA